jgi:hypothetical protein
MPLDFSTIEEKAKRGKNSQVSSDNDELEEKAHFSEPESLFKMFNFNTNGLEETFRFFVNSTSLLPQFSPGDIKIKHPSEMDMTHPDFSILMATKGNKPIDVIVFLHSIVSDQYSENKEMFEFSNVEDISQKTFITNVTILAFSYLLYMTRGNLPRENGSSSQNALPKLLKDNIEDETMMVESDFAKASASFNLEKLDAKFFFLIDKKNMPAQIINRIKKGSAGSRSLKFFKMVLDRPHLNIEGFDNHEKEVLKVLQEKVSMSQSYLSLHPAHQIVQAQVDKFYPSMLSFGARLIGEDNWPEFVAEICKIPTFDKDNTLKGLSIRSGIVYFQNSKFEHGFKSINSAVLDRLFGEPY